MTRKLSNVGAEVDLSERSIGDPLTAEAKALVNERVERARRVRSSMGGSPQRHSSMSSASPSPRSLPTRSPTRGVPRRPSSESTDDDELNPDYREGSGERGLFV